MKIRNGFVSNSSSCSFTVAFPEIPRSKEEVEEMLFPNGETSYGRYEVSSTIKVAETVWKDIQNQKPNDRDKIWEAIHGELQGAPDFTAKKFRLKKASGGTDIDWRAYDKARCEHRHKVIADFYKDNPSTYIYCFQYSDDNVYESTLMYDGLFNALPSITTRS